MKKQILTIAVAVTCLSGFVSSVQAKSSGHHSGHTASTHSGRGGHGSKGGHGGASGISGNTASEAIDLFRDLINR